MAAHSWDIVVIGGGPAGLLAAGICGHLVDQQGKNLSVLLLEKNHQVGRKLLLTGSGTCNISNRGTVKDNPVEREPPAVSAAREMAGCFHYFPSENRPVPEPTAPPLAARDLVGLFSRFPPALIARLLGPDGLLGIPLVERENGRLFPASESAREVRDALAEFARKGGVTIWCGVTVVGMVEGEQAEAGRGIASVVCADGRNITAKYFILATGGSSYPVTGSTGDAITWLGQLGLDVLPPWPALAPILVREKWLSEIAGLGLPEVAVSVWLETPATGNAAPVMAALGRPEIGPILFTHRGLSGPVILHLSAWLLRLDRLLHTTGQTECQIVLKIDLVTGQSREQLMAHLDHACVKHPHQHIRTWLAEWLTQAAADLICRKVLATARDCPLGHLPRTTRQLMVDTLKGLPVHYTGNEGFGVAMSSAGGLQPRELDWKTMSCKQIRNLYVVGDAVSLDRRSGGYSLLFCWASALAVASGCAAALNADGFSAMINASV